MKSNLAKSKKLLIPILTVALFAMVLFLLTACGNNVCLVRFYVDEELYRTVKVDKGGVLDDVPEVPAREGYKGTWSIRDFDEVTADLNVYAVYEKVGYKVTFYADDAVVSDVTLTRGQILSDIPAVPEKEGYDGVWSITNFAEIKSDTSVYAVYTKRPIYARFYTQTGAERTLYATVPVENGRVTEVPEAPAEEGKNARWLMATTEGGAESLIAPDYSNVTRDVAYVAHPYVTLTLVDRFGEQESEYADYEVGDRIASYKVKTLTASEDYAFYGWCLDEEMTRDVSYPYTLTKNTVWYAKWVSVRASEGLTYEGAVVVGYTGADADVYVPYRYLDENENPVIVTAIGENAFAGSALTKIRLPATVTEIGEGAFRDSMLTEVVLPDGAYVTRVGREAFAGCAQLTGFTLSGQLTELGEGAFRGCERLETVTGLASIRVDGVGAHTFDGCASLVAVNLPSGIRTIGEYAFNGCTNATFNVADPDAIRTVEAYAFGYCEKFAGFTAEHVVSVAADAYVGCFAMTEVTFSAEEGSLAAAFGTRSEIRPGDDDKYYYVDNGATYAVPAYLYAATVVGRESCDALRSYALADMVSLKNVRLIGITTIERSAFSAARSTVTGGELSLTLPQELTTIEAYAFEGRNDLVRLNLPATLTSVGERAFYGLTQLTYVTLPDRNALTSVGAYAFDGTEWFEDCDKAVLLGKCVLGVSGAYCRRTGYSAVTAADMGFAERIAPHAFDGNEYIESVTLGRYVYEVGDLAFAGMPTLTAFAFNNAGGLLSARQLGETVLRGTGVRALTLYEDVDVESLFDGAPTSVTELTVLYGGGDSAVKKGAYEALTSLRSLTVGEGYATIEEDAFASCPLLENVTIAESVRSIGARAFRNTNATVLAIEEYGRLTTIGEEAFSGTPLARVRVATRNEDGALVSDEEAEEGFPAGLTTIGDRAFFGVEIASFRAPQSLTTIGESAFEGVTTLSSVTLGDRLTTLGDYAFYGCSVKVLVLPQTLSDDYARSTQAGEEPYLGVGAFGNNAALTTLTLEWGLKANDLFIGKDGAVHTPSNLAVVRVLAGSIPDEAFYGDAEIQSLTLSKGVTAIGARAFEGCATIRSVTVPNTVERIGDRAFAACARLSSCQIDTMVSALKSVGREVYAGDVSLSYAVFPRTVESADWTGIFDGCVSLTTTNIPDAVTTIGAYAYRNCSRLVGIDMSDGIREIRESAFEGCSSIDFDDVKFDALNTIGTRAFANCASMRALKGKNLTSVGKDAYYGCTLIEEVTVAGEPLAYYTDKKATLTTINVVGDMIGEDFSGCDALETIVYYGASQTAVAERTAGVDKEAVTIFVVNETYQKMTNKTGYHAFPAPTSLFTFATDASTMTATITGVTAAFSDPTAFDGVAYLPEEVTTGGKTYVVTAIGDNALAQTGVQRVVLPSSVRTIGASAFYRCAQMTSFRFENGSDLAEIRQSAFKECTALQKLILPSSLTTIGASVFQGCAGLGEMRFYVNSKLTEAGAYAFGQLESLTSVAFTGPIASLGNNLFYACTALEQVTFSEKSTFATLPQSAFSGCGALAGVTLPASLRTIGKNAFRSCASLRNVVFPAGLRALEEGAFSQSGLVTVGWNDGLTTIGASAFESCERLTAANLPDSVTTVGKDAFKNDFGLTYVRLGAGIKTLGDGAFNTARSLTAIRYDATEADDLAEGNAVFRYAGRSGDGIALTVGSGVKRIPAYAFNATGDADTAPYVTQIAFEETPSCKEIGAYAFANIASVYNVLLPVSVLRAGSGVFSGCTALVLTSENAKAPAAYAADWDDGLLTAVTYGEGNRTSSGYVYVLHEGKAYLTAYNGAESDVEVPDELDGAPVASIGAAFEKNATMERITLPAHVTDMGSYYECTGLRRVYVEGEVTEIPDRAFYGCVALNRLNVKATVERIGRDAFVGCSALYTVYVDSAAVAAQLSDPDAVGSMMDNVLSAYVKADAVRVDEAYTLLPVTKDGYAIYTVLYSEEGETEADTVFAYWIEGEEEGEYEMTVAGSGNMREYGAMLSMKWHPYRNAITQVTIGENVNKPARNAFANMTALRSVRYNTTQATFAEDKNAFSGSGTSDLTLYIGANVTTIPAYLFNGNTRLSAIRFAETGALTSVGNNAFYGCGGLKTLTLPQGLESVGAYAFAYAGLENVTVNEEMLSFGTRAFYGNASLASVRYNATEMPDTEGNEGVFGSATGGAVYGDGFTLYVGGNVKRIPAYAFYECSNLIGIEIPDRAALTEIGAEAFYKCPYVTAVTLPTSLRTIGERAFAEDTGLADIGLSSGTAALTEIGAEAFLNTAFYNDNDNWTTIGEDTTQSVLYFRTRYLIKAKSGLSGEYAISGASVVANEAFYGCNGLEYIRIPAEVTYIGADAFRDCTGLKTVYLLSRTVASGLEEENAFGALVKNATHIYVLQSLIDDSKIKVGRYVSERFTAIQSVVRFREGTYYAYTTAAWSVGKDGASVLAYLLNDEENTGRYVLHLTGAGDSTDYEAGAAPWREYLKTISGVRVASGVTGVGAAMFYACEEMTSVTFPITLVRIGREAFAKCSSLTEVEIKDNVTTIGDGAFSECTGLQTVKYTAKEAEDLVAHNNVFYKAGTATETGILVKIDRYVRKVPAYLMNPISSTEGAPKVKRVIFESSADRSDCASVGAYAFAYLKDLASVTFAAGPTLSTIGEGAFLACRSLSQVNLTAGMQRVGVNAFKDCSGLTTVAFNATEFTENPMDSNAFENAGQTSGGFRLEVSYKAKSLPAHLFEKASYLVGVDFEEGSTLERIGENAFEDCTALTTITVPNSVMTIGRGAFSGCTSMTKYVAPFIGGLGEQTSANEATLFGFVFGETQKTGTTMTTQSYGSVGSSYFRVPDSLRVVEITKYTNVFYGSFMNCASIVQITIRMAAGLGIDRVISSETDESGNTHETANILNGSVLAPYAFYNCSNLTTLTLPPQVEAIGTSAFEGCAMLSQVTIARNVASIGAQAFKDCRALRKIEFNAVNCADTGKDSVSTNVFVNAGTDQAGIDVVFGAEVTRVPAYLFAVSLKDGVNPKLASVSFESGTVESGRTIGTKAFYMAGKDTLTSITLPGDIVAIGPAAFEGTAYWNDDENWRNATLTIGRYLLKARLTTIRTVTEYTVQDGISLIADEAFKDCAYLITVVLSDGVLYIGRYAFKGCSSLVDLRVSASSNLVRIGQEAFANCVKLGSEDVGFRIASNVTTIEQDAFNSCIGLDSVYLDSAAVAAGLSEDSFTVYGGVTHYAKTIYVSTAVPSLGGYVSSRYQLIGTPTGGYYRYVKTE